jgi:hypothetical protein
LSTLFNEVRAAGYFSELIKSRLAFNSLVTVLTVGAAVGDGSLFVVEGVGLGCGLLSSTGAAGTSRPALLAGCGKSSNATSSAPKVLVNIGQILYFISVLSTHCDVIFTSTSSTKTY